MFEVETCQFESFKRDVEVLRPWKSDLARGAYSELVNFRDFEHFLIILGGMILTQLGRLSRAREAREPRRSARRAPVASARSARAPAICPKLSLIHI